MRHTPHGNGTLAFDDVGSGRPIVLVHGFPLDSGVWQDVVPILSRSRRVITVDLPGFGKSTLDEPMSMLSLAESLGTLLGELRLPSATFAGLSMGGYVLQALVQAHPEWVERLVLVDTRASADDEKGRAGRDAMAAMVRQDGTPAVVKAMLPKMFHPDTYASRPELVERLSAIMHTCPPLTIEYACIAMRDRADFTDKLASLPCPLSIIVGEGDAITPPEGARAMQNAAPGSRLHVIPNAGHIAPLEAPEAVAVALLD
jgi:3-oxoadipate enol-lactonase